VTETGVFVSVDMEGIAGITTVRQGRRGTDDYAWARELMTEEANAAVAGAVEGGANVVVVSDSHGDMGNLLPHGLDPRAELVQGTPKTPLSMMTGIAEGFGCAVFVGYHAGASTQDAILDHTFTGFITDVRVNGESWNETHLNAALAGTYGVPVAVVTGDRACCEQAKQRLPWVETVVVKEGFGSRVGRSRSPEHARASIRQAVRASMQRLDTVEAWRPSGPFTFELDLVSSAVADVCALMPGTERVGPRTTRFVTEDFREVYRCLLTWMHLGMRVAPITPVE
jgi:D-amino peptidase